MKKKILSLALACIMLVSAFTAMLPVSATDTAFTVTSSSGGTIGNYSTYEDALAAVYTAAKTNNTAIYTINFNNSYESSARLNTHDKSNNDKLDDDSDSTNPEILNAKIEINGNGYTLKSSGSSPAFEFNFGDNVTVKNLNVETGGRIAEIYRGTSITFEECDFKSTVKLGSSSFDYGGYFRTPSPSTGTEITANYLTLTNCTISELLSSSKGTVVFGNASQENVMNVTLNNFDVDLSAYTNVRLFCVRGRSRSSVISIKDSDIKVPHYVFSMILSGTINLTGDTKLTSTGNKAIFEIDSNAVEDVNVNLGENVALTSNTLWNNKSSSYSLELALSNPNTYFPNEEFKLPILDEGASVRTTVHSNGLRFSATLTDDTAYTGGMLVTLTSKLTSTGFTADALGYSGSGYVLCDSRPEYISDGKYYIVLTGIPDISNKYSVIAYTVYDMGSGVKVKYYDADTYNETKNSRSIAQVAHAAVNDTSETRTDTHTCKIADDKYSPYSKAQFSILDGRYACRYDPTNDAVSAKTNANMWTESTEEDILVRDITIDNGDDTVDDITVIQLTDLHLVYANEEDFADDPTLKAKYNERIGYWGKAETNTKKVLTWAKDADQIVLTGDIYDFLTSEVVTQANSFIFSAYNNIMVCLGNHDAVTGGALKDKTVEERMNGNWYVPAEEEGDMFYSSKIIDGKVMLIQMDNGTSTAFAEAQYTKLSGDLATARDAGYTVFLFYHVPLATGNPEDIAVQALRHGNGTESVNNFYNIKAGDLVGHESEGWSGKVYDLIVSNGDVIKGAFCGHLHSDFYTELQATTADGMYTVIPQYVLRGNSYENGHALRITVK